MKRIIFFEPGLSATTSAVLHSQFLMQARHLAEMGAHCYFFGADAPHNVTDERIYQLKCRYKLTECRVLPVEGHGKDWLAVQNSVNIAAKSLRQEISQISPDILYSWSINAAFKLEEMKAIVKAPTVFFCQGAQSEEIRLRGQWSDSLKSQIFAFSERKLFRQADRVIAVSENMRSWIHQLAPNAQVDILPCCFDEELFQPMPESKLEIRTQLGWRNDVPVVIYVGGTSYWQCLEEIIALFSQLQRILHDLHIIFLISGEKENLRSKAEEARLISSQLFVGSAPHDDIPKWMSAADVSIIFRRDNLVNRVSSPIKIGEYLGCGLPVIATGCIGDYSQYIANENAGLILNEPIDISGIKCFLQNREGLHERASNALRLSHKFSWRMGRAALSKIFDLY